MNTDDRINYLSRIEAFLGAEEGNFLQLLRQGIALTDMNSRALSWGLGIPAMTIFSWTTGDVIPKRGIQHATLLKMRKYIELIS